GNWVARMLDIVSVAGHRYDSIDRKHYEEDEGSWMKASNKGSSLREYPLVSSPVDLQESTVRKRRAHNSTTAKVNDGENKPPLSFEKEVSTMSHRPQDGDWSFTSSRVVNQESEDIDIKITPRSASATQHGSSLRPNNAPNANQYHPLPVRRRPTSRDDDPILPIQEPISRLENDDIQSLQHVGYGIPEKDNIPTSQEYSTVGGGDKPSAQNAVTYSTPMTYELKSEALSSRPYVDLSQHRNHMTLDTNRQRYRDQAGQGVTHNNDIPNIDVHSAQSRVPLLLTNETPYAYRRNIRPESLTSPPGDPKAIHDQARDEFVVDKWQQRFQERQKERSRGTSENNRDRRRDSRRRPTRSSTRQESRGSFHKPKSREPIRHYKPEAISRDPDLFGLTVARRHLQSHQYWGPANALNLFTTDAKIHLEVMLKEGWVLRPGPEISTNATTFIEEIPFPQADAVHLDDQMSDVSVERGRKRVKVLNPSSEQDKPLVARRSPPPLSSPARKMQSAKSALRAPTERFPEDPDFVRPGVAPSGVKDVPKDARWTKIRRELVSPEVLERGGERFEASEDFVIVLRVLSREEIEQYAIETQNVRSQREAEVKSNDFNDDTGSENSGNSKRSFVRQQESDDDNLSAEEDGNEPPENLAQQNLSRVDSENLVMESAKGRRRRRSHSAHGSEGGTATSYRSSSFRPASRRRTIVAQSNDSTEGTESLGGHTRRRLSTHSQSLMDEEILTYAEEIMFLQSDHILKKLTSFTESCKDITTTLQFVQSVQPAIEPNVMETHHLIKETNGSIKALLYHIGPLREDKKIANIVITSLSTLLLGLELSLEILQTNFDLFDITHLKPSERQEAWKKTLSLSESEYGRPLNEQLAIIRSFSAEIASNFQAGIFTSPEADLLKKRLDEAIPSGQARSRVTPEAVNIRRHEKSQFRS
ncbi:MAG: hypothetical protein Q9169_008337, partial [Polycauliona sp. 2 TL-2023]